MKEERMLILSMLQDGKIDADEAASLLEALGGLHGDVVGDHGEGAKKAGRDGGAAGSGGAGAGSATQLWDDVVQRLGKARDRFESTIEQARKRMDSARSQAETAGSSAAEDIDEFFGSVERGLSRVVTDLPDALARLMRFDFGVGSYKEVQWEYEGGFPAGQETVDVAVFTGDGNVTIETTDEDSYRVVVNNKVLADDEEEAAAIAAEATRWEEFSGGWRLEAGEGRDVRANVRVTLPARVRYRIDAQTADGNITAKDVRAAEMQLNSADGNMRLDRIDADVLSVTTADGNVRVSGDIGTLRVATADGIVTAAYEAANGVAGRDLGEADGGSRSEFEWDLRSSDGGIRVHLPTGSDIGHQLDLLTADGSVRVQLPSMEQTSSGTARRGVQMETPGFAQKGQRFTVRVRTADGSVTVKEVGAERTDDGPGTGEQSPAAYGAQEGSERQDGEQRDEAEQHD